MEDPDAPSSRAGFRSSNTASDHEQMSVASFGRVQACERAVVKMRPWRYEMYLAHTYTRALSRYSFHVVQTHIAVRTDCDVCSQACALSSIVNLESLPCQFIARAELPVPIATAVIEEALVAPCDGLHGL